MTTKRPSEVKEDLVLTLWEECKSASAGVVELTLIQSAMRETYGLVESPASIARTLADNRVPLRHPEILEADAKWREGQIGQSLDVRMLDFATIEAAAESMKTLELVRRRVSTDADESALQSVIEQAREIKVELSRRSTVISREIVHWLVVWLQNPEIFEDWLDLRRKSPEFNREFASDQL
jgi:hypothetical protein